MAAPMQDCAILFGDSITSRQEVEGSIQAKFCDSYRRTLDIINRGYGGYNTSWVKPLFDKIFARKEDADRVPVVRLVTIWFGANDSVLPTSPTRQHIPLDEYTANLHFFMTQLTSPSSPYAVAHTPGLNIVLVTPPPLYPGMMDTTQFRTQRDPKVTATYAQAVRDVAAEWKKKEAGQGIWKVALLDMWEGILKEAGGDDEELRPFFNDGLHLSAEGYAVFWKEYTKLVKGEFAGRGLDYADVNDLPLRVPDMSEVDPNDTDSVVRKMRLPAVRGG